VSAQQATDLPDGINLNNDCPYVGANTASCAPGATATATCTANASGDFCCPFN